MNGLCVISSGYKHVERVSCEMVTATANCMDGLRVTLSCCRLEPNMALLMVSSLVVMVASVLGHSDHATSITNASSVNESRNFPLSDCSSDQMDVLFLYFDDEDFTDTLIQQNMATSFADAVLSEHDNQTSPRVLFASVYDRFATQGLPPDVNSWYFHPSLGAPPYGAGGKTVSSLSSWSVKEVLELKITFVHSLFSEMAGVRENITHVAIIFLNGAGFTSSDIRNIPGIVRQYDTHTKIFVAVLGGDNEQEIVHMSDFIYVPYQVDSVLMHILAMAICKKCLQSWFHFEHSDNTNDLSCYKMLNSGLQIDWFKAMSMCRNDQGGYLVAIETFEELNFLRTSLYTHIKELGNYSRDARVFSQLKAEVYIGLNRDSTSFAKRFQWSLKNPVRVRPLVINNWMSGKPSGGHSNGCGVWQFVWSDHKDEAANLSGGSDRFVEGWADVGCRTKLSSISLCEVTFPRRIEDRKIMKINPATKESFSKVLGRKDFIKFGENIVSFSAHVASKHLVALLNTKESQFPFFDCGIDAGIPRYVSYSYVCDYTDHCNNRRDETTCAPPSGPYVNCRNGQGVVNVNVFCDTIIDCLDGTDEENCEDHCNGIYCCDGSCLPLQWVNDGDIDCTVCEYLTETANNDETEILNKYMMRNETCAIICNYDKCVNFSQLNDGHFDCTGPEGPLDEILGKLETADTCYNKLGHRMWAPRCVYVRDRYGAVMGCRDVSHLKACMDFECPQGYFKCWNTYCIPQHYVLDETIDCPTGEDEQDDSISPCAGNFACWNSKICLHPDLVCDGHPDCPRQDDEMDCEMSCADGFRCISGTVTLSSYNKSIPLESLSFIDKTTRYVDLSGVDLRMLNTAYTPYQLEHAVIAILSGCQIDELPNALRVLSHQIQTLDISDNAISKISGNDSVYDVLLNLRYFNLSYNRGLVVVEYLQMLFLEVLDLSHTGLLYLDRSVLMWLPNLRHLNLSFTPISGFSKYAFSSNLLLQTLDLRGIIMNDYYEEYFNGLTSLTISQHLYTDNFDICCPQTRRMNIPYHICHAPEATVSSCFDLLGITFQRVLLWMFAVLAVLGNLTVIVYRLIWDRSVLRTGYGLFVTNLGISDFIMGVYLFIIAGADYYYRGVYVLYDNDWSTSIACNIASFLATLSSETSTCFVFLITLDRFLVVKFPFRQIRFSKMSKGISLLLSWIIGLIIALIPVVFKFEIHSSNAMCLGLPLSPKRPRGWGFSFGVFIVLNFLMFVAIAYGQTAIFRAMWNNRLARTASGAFARRPDDIIVAKQLSLVVLSNFMCWFPVGLIGLLSLGEYEISNDAYAWITVIVLPLNSAANPLLYTIPALMDRWEKFKYGDSIFQKNVS